jgi:TolA-binding protein
MRKDCDRGWEIDALREGTLRATDAAAFRRHARACEVCSAAIARDTRLRELAALLPPGEPNELEQRRSRARVLHAIATGTPAHRAPYSAIAVALVLGLIAFVSWAAARSGARAGVPVASTVSVSPPPLPADVPADAYASVVLRADGARWSRIRDGLVERIRLNEGTLRIHVRRQSGAERFLVELPDGELEVRGTTFEVTAHTAATDWVRVEEGVVAVRINGLAEVELNPGEVWSALASAQPPRSSARAAAPGSARTIPHKATAVIGSALTSDGAPRDDGTEAYAAAIALLQGGRYSAAVSAFRAFVLGYPRAPQLEDASFLEAAALARAGRHDAAALAAEEHLARFPTSFHRREAAILVARAARDRGDCTEARTVLAPWLSNPRDDEARATVERCTGQ